MELPFYNRKFSVEHNQDSVLFNTKIGVKVGLKEGLGREGGLLCLSIVLIGVKLCTIRKS